MHALFCWTFVNLIDGEAAWFLQLAALLGGMWVVGALGSRVVAWMARRYEARERPFAAAFAEASWRALLLYGWVVVVAYGIDLVADGFVSSQYRHIANRAFGCLAVVAGGAMLLRFKRDALRLAVEQHKGVGVGHLYSLSKLATVAIFIVTALLLLEVSGQSFHTLVAVGGIGGLALAFASQEIIANFFWGVMLHLHRPFAVGELVAVTMDGYEEPLEGHVESIGWHQTMIRDTDKKAVYLPNALIGKAVVVNHSRMSHRRLLLIFPIRQDDVAQAPVIIKAIKGYLDNHAAVDHSQPAYVHIHGVGLSSVDIRLSAHAAPMSDEAFYGLRDEVMVRVVELISASKARLARHALAGAAA